MLRTGLGMVLVLIFALPAPAADKPKVEKQGATGAPRSPTTTSKSVGDPLCGYGPPAAPTERMVIRLNHVPVSDVANALQRLLSSEQQRPAFEYSPDSHRAILVPEPVSNSLLISGTSHMVNALTKLITQLDRPRDTVMVHVCIAELLPPARDAKKGTGASDASAAEKAPSMEGDGAAWLAWAKKQGRLKIVCRPQIMTLDNQPACLQIGTTGPTAAPKPGTASPARGQQIRQPNVGLTIGLTPRISPDGLVVMELDVERTSVLKRDGAAGPTLEKTLVQTTVSAKDGQTIVVGGLIERARTATARRSSPLPPG